MNLLIVNGYDKNGWAIGTIDSCDDKSDAESLYQLLENEIIPTFYNNRSEWIKLMKSSIKTGVDYTAIRMVNEYRENYYGIKKLERIVL